MSKFIDLTGQKFGEWTVLEYVGKSKWLCRCECGTERNIESGSLRRGRTTSCGCTSKQQYDLTGQKFGRLTVIERTDSDNHGNSMWLCECDCGNIKIVQGSNLTQGKTVSCGCYMKERVSETHVKDLTGQKFGRLTVIERAGSDKQNKAVWICKCECGNITKPIPSDKLISGNTSSCGCLQKDRVIEVCKGKPRSDKNKRKISEGKKGKYCGEKNPNYKGGITPISNYLRAMQIVKQWRKDTYIRENSKCQLTGNHVHGGNSDVHHLKAFNIIVQEAHDLHEIEIKEIVADYTEQELKLLEDYVTSWHTDTTNAVLLSDEVHDLFHHEYGYGDNTPEQFEEFKERYLAGEFDNSDSNNNKVA